MLYLYTFYTDETRLLYLKESALLHNVEIRYIKKDCWNGYVDKIVAIDNILEEHADNDIICFIDAYDVLVNQNAEYLLDQFNHYNCDLLIGAELNCFPEKYKIHYPLSNAKNIYVNSGGYIGYKYAIQRVFRWRSYSDIHYICSDGGDQSYFTEYYLSNHSDKIRLDTECRIFQNMHLINWNELRFKNGKLYNTIMCTTPCFIHFNGGTWRQNNDENIMPVFLSKMKSTLENQSVDDLHHYSQLITATCYPHPQI